VIRINLMPREERIRRRSLPAIKMPNVGAFMPVVVLGGVVASMVMVATVQKREVTRLETEIAALRQESESYKPQLEKIREITQKRQEVSNRLDIIAKLDQERYFRVKLMDEVCRSVPENVWLTKVAETGPRQFQVEGVTFSNLLVARLMENLEAAPHWENVELGVAQQGEIDKTNVVQFSLMSGAQP
jgi:type IV pilus assembly protein PilN